MVCCSNAEVRAEAEAAIRASGILKLYPGFGIGSSTLPLEQPGLVRALTDVAEEDTEPALSTDSEDAPGHTTTEATGPLVGRRIRILRDLDRGSSSLQSRRATGGAVIRIGEQEFQITACHAIVGEPIPETAPGGLNDWSFDGMDDESEDEDEDTPVPDTGAFVGRFLEASRPPHPTPSLPQSPLPSSAPPILHRYDRDISSMSSEDHEQADSNTNTTCEGTGSDGNSRSTPRPSRQGTTLDALEIPATAFLFKSEESSNPGLEYALIPVPMPSGSDSQWRPNEIQTQHGDSQVSIEIECVAGIPTDARAVIAVTASRGVTPGTLIPTAMYFRNAKFPHFQSLYPVQLWTRPRTGCTGTS